MNMFKATATVMVTATEFAKNFGKYREIAQREPVAVSSHGRVSGYFISGVEFEEYLRVREQLAEDPATSAGIG